MKIHEHFSNIFSIKNLDEVCQKYVKWQKRTGKLFGFNILGKLDGGVECLYMDNIITVPYSMDNFIFYDNTKRKILITPKNLEFYGLVEFKDNIYKKSDCLWVYNDLGEKVLRPKTLLDTIKKDTNISEDVEKHIVVVSNGSYLLTSIDNTVLARTHKGNKRIHIADAVCYQGKFYSKEFVSNSYKFKYNKETGEIIERTKQIAKKIRAGMAMHRQCKGDANTNALFNRKEVFVPCNTSNDGVYFGVEIEKMKECEFDWVDKYIMLADGFVLHYDATVNFEIASPVFTTNDNKFWEKLSNIYNNYNLKQKTASAKCGGHINVSVTENGESLSSQEIFNRIKPIAHLIYGTNNKRTANKYCKVENMSVELSNKKYNSFYMKGNDLLEIRIFGEHLSVEQIKSRTALLDLVIRKKYADEKSFYEDVLNDEKVKEIFANFLANEKRSLYEIMYWLSVTMKQQKQKMNFLKNIQSIIEDVYYNNKKKYRKSR